MKSVFRLDSKFAKILETMINLLMINVLFILFSLPIFTIGASLTAMYTLTLRLVRNEHQYIWKSFFESFKSNFKQATILWLGVLLSGFIIYANVSFIRYISGIGYIILFVGLVIFSLLFLAIVMIVFPVLSRFDNSVINTIKNSLMLVLMNPLKSILLLIMTYSPMLIPFISPSTLLTTIYIATYGGFAIIAWLQSHVIQRIFHKVEGVAVEG